MAKRTKSKRLDKSIHQPGNMRASLGIKKRRTKQAPETESERVKRLEKDARRTRDQLRTKK